MALESGNLETESRALTGLGYSYQALGDHYEALSCQRRALTLARDTGERSFEAEALNGVAEALHVSAEPAQALDHLRQAVKIAEQTGDAFELAHAHATIAAIYLDTDRLEKAEHHRLQAVTGYSRLGVPESEAIRRLAKTRQ